MRSRYNIPIALVLSARADFSYEWHIFIVVIVLQEGQRMERTGISFINVPANQNSNYEREFIVSLALSRLITQNQG